MLKSLHRTLVAAAVLTGTFAFVPAASAAPVVQGVVGTTIGTSEVAEFSDVRYVSGGTGALEPAILVCIDLNNAFPNAGTTHTYTMLGSDVAPITQTAAGARAADLFNFAVDRFYDSMVVNESGGSTGFQFSALMWEIQKDFNGTASSLNELSGNMKAEMIGLNGAVAYQTMVRELRDNYASIELGYRSTQYTVSFLDDTTAGYQNMMMLTPLTNTSEVPEPGTLALSLLGGLAFFRRQQRAKVQQA
jgi:hypothetical protein